MAHFANLDENNYVREVIVVNNSELIDDNGKESENRGIEFCKQLYGNDTIWVQTSYNNTFRKNYAGVGYFYDKDKDVFIPPQPYTSWVLNNDTCIWESPIPYPTDQIDKIYNWDEENKKWVLS